MEFELKSNEDKLIEDIIGFKGKILYGIPEDTSQRGIDKNGKPVYNNAQILAVMEAGSPTMEIPARELLGPVVKKHKDKIQEIFGKVFDALISGDNKTAEHEMEVLAQRIEMWCKAYFREDNDWTPNSPITIHGGWMKNKKSGKPFYVKGKGSDMPLIDTGALRSAIRAIFVKS